MYKRTCYTCGEIFETKYYFSFFCEKCCAEKINLKVRKQKKLPIAIASYSGYIGYLKWILKQPDWIKLLNTKKQQPERTENFKGEFKMMKQLNEPKFTHSRF